MTQKVVQWYCASSLPAEDIPEGVSPTRDIFQARLDHLYRTLATYQSFSKVDASLLTAVCGEIGNNCFDHNLGQWQDQPGCWFTWNLHDNRALVFISDRGQGVLASLKKVKRDLKDESGALRVAFEKVLSGRHPEQRGNGLKFVRSIINGHRNRGLLFFSGSAKIEFGGLIPKEKESIQFKKGTGTLAIIEWEKS